MPQGQPHLGVDPEPASGTCRLTARELGCVETHPATPAGDLNRPILKKTYFVLGPCLFEGSVLYWVYWEFGPGASPALFSFLAARSPNRFVFDSLQILTCRPEMPLTIVKSACLRVGKGTGASTLIVIHFSTAKKLSAASPWRKRRTLPSRPTCSGRSKLRRCSTMTLAAAPRMAVAPRKRSTRAYSSAAA